MKTLQEVRDVCKRITMSAFGIDFELRVERDMKDPVNGRVFLQVVYNAGCSKSGVSQGWRGRKWYLSSHMTADEIVKTAYAAFDAAVKHEMSEGFKIDNKVLFNPHISFEQLLQVSHIETLRPDGPS